MEEVKNKKEITKRLIKEFHQIVIGDIDREIAGKFRTWGVGIGGSATETAKFYHIEEELDKLIDNYNKDEKDIIEKVARFHADFEKIHPFGDGNGRTGRLLMNLELMKEGYPITIIKLEDRLEYYDSLEKAQTTNDYQGIINFIYDNVKRSIIKNLELVEENWENNFKEYLKESKKQIKSC